MDEAYSADLARLRDMIDGYRVSRAIIVAAMLGIADHLADGSKAVDVLAEATGAQPTALVRLMRALASVGVVAEEEDGRFSLMPLGRGLRSDAPQSVRSWAIHTGQPYIWEAWGQLRHSVVTGEPAFHHVHGMSAWEYRTRHPEAGRIFDAAMDASADELIPSIVEAYRFADAGCVVDVGGGRGALITAILSANPATRGVLFDTPRVVADVESRLLAAGVLDRCTVVGGDFFDSIPAGGDLYLLKAIVHDWDDASAVRILSNCRRAMEPGSKLVLVELVLPDRAGVEPDRFRRFMDLQMLVVLGGRERTRDDFANLLAASGFRLAQVIPTTSGLDIIEAIAVS